MKKIFVIVIATVLCLAVIGGVFALYKIDAPAKNISITAGGAATLTIGGGEDFTISPANDADHAIIQNITLNDNVVDALPGSGILKVVISDVGEGQLAQYIDVSFTKTTDDNFATADGDAISESTLAAGKEYALSALPIYGKLAIVCTATDAQFKDVSGDKVNIVITWNYVDFAPTNNTWYLIGTNTGWSINENAIAINDENHPGNNAQKINATLAAGEWKAVFYQESLLEDDDTPYSGMVWSTNDNKSVETAGAYDIYINTSDELYIAPHSNN